MEWKLKTQVGDIIVYTCGCGLMDERYILKGIKLCTGQTVWTMKDRVTLATTSVDGPETAFDDFLRSLRLRIEISQYAIADLEKLLEKEKITA